MKIDFYKYQGTGNDFILIDNRLKTISLQQDTIRLLCDRRFGIGGDGLILLEETPGFDFCMVYFNSDGRESTFCGNGGRCIASFAKLLGLADQQTRFIAKDGTHEASFLGPDVRLKMQDVKQINLVVPGFLLFTGSPHYVEFRENVSSLDVEKEGRAIRNQKLWKKEGINVNFIEKKKKSISVRTYERGVENETYSCGTGVTASALSSSLFGYTSPVQVETPGGTLQVEFQKSDDHSFTEIYLTGPATLVFQGTIEI